MLICVVESVILKDKTGPFYCGSCVVGTRQQTDRITERGRRQPRQNGNKPELRTAEPPRACLY